MSASQFPEELYHEIEPPRPCSYLPTETASLEYRSYRGLNPSQLESLLQRGWRRFGIDVFRPACAACSACTPVRVDVNEFKPDKSQRRTLRKNEHIRVSLHSAGVSQAHIDLYNAWHVDMTTRKGWRPQAHTFEQYARSFLIGEFPSTHELRYYDGEKLVGVGIIDVLPHSLSSVYFYHDPDWRDRGPGTFSLLCELDLAKQLGLDFVYLGYWIGQCPSMAYKNRFHPYQVLHSRPDDEQEPAWLKGSDENHNVATSDG